MERHIAMAPWRVNIATVTTVSVNMGMDYRGMEGAVGAVRDTRFFWQDKFQNNNVSL